MDQASAGGQKDLRHLGGGTNRSQRGGPGDTEKVQLVQLDGGPRERGRWRVRGGLWAWSP